MSTDGSECNDKLLKIGRVIAASHALGFTKESGFADEENRA